MEAQGKGLEGRTGETRNVGRGVIEELLVSSSEVAVKGRTHEANQRTRHKGVKDTVCHPTIMFFSQDQ